MGTSNSGGRTPNLEKESNYDDAFLYDSQLFCVQTPWGLVPLKLLPEDIELGLLQSIVREIFNNEDFPDWTIMIFDNYVQEKNDRYLSFRSCVLLVSENFSWS